MIDLLIEYHGPLCLLRPKTAAGSDWLNATAPEDAQFLGNAMAVEPRYLDNVVQAAIDDGMEVS